MDAEPVAFGIKHLDPDLTRHSGGVTFECGTKRLETSPFFTKTDSSFVIGQFDTFTTNRVHVQVNPLIGSSPVVPLEEDAWPHPFRVDGSRDVVAILLGNARGIGKLIPGLETIRRRLSDVAQGTSPKLGRRPGSSHAMTIWTEYDIT